MKGKYVIFQEGMWTSECLIHHNTICTLVKSFSRMKQISLTCVVSPENTLLCDVLFHFIYLSPHQSGNFMKARG